MVSDLGLEKPCAALVSAFVDYQEFCHRPGWKHRAQGNYGPASLSSLFITTWKLPPGSETRRCRRDHGI